MKLLPEWKRSWRWFSVQLSALGAVASPAWLLVPEDMRAAVPPEWLAFGAGAFFVLIAIGRLVAQDG